MLSVGQCSCTWEHRIVPDGLCTKIHNILSAANTDRSVRTYDPLFVRRTAMSQGKDVRRRSSRQAEGQARKSHMPSCRQIFGEWKTRSGKEQNARVCATRGPSRNTHVVDFHESPTSAAVRGEASVVYEVASRTPLTRTRVSTGCRSAFSGTAHRGDGVFRLHEAYVEIRTERANEARRWKHQEHGRGRCHLWRRACSQDVEFLREQGLPRSATCSPSIAMRLGAGTPTVRRT
jgi:hypothetical protein